MSKIGDVFNKYVKPEKPQLFKPLTTEQTATPATVEQFIKSAEDSYPSSKLGQALSQAKDEVMKPLDEFIKDHPSLELFVPALVAGGVAGWLDKKMEEKEKAKKLTNYLENLEKFTHKVERQVKYYNVLDKTANIAYRGFYTILPGFILTGITHSAIPFLGAMGVTFGSAIIGNVAGLLYKDRLKSKDGSCLMTKHHNFVTIPPDGDKLIFYKVECSDRKLVPTKEIKLNGKATYLSIDKKDKKSFFVNYEDGAKDEFLIKDETVKQEEK